jgi:hypothetical protein
MANLRGFDAASVEPSEGFEPLPAGKYNAVITDSETRENKAGTGSYLRLTFQIMDDPYQGRLLWENLNLEHPNAQAVQIAQGKLSAICRAVGVLQPQDSQELHDLPLVVKVRCKKRADTGEITNELQGFVRKEVALLNGSSGSAQQAPWRR